MRALPLVIITVIVLFSGCARQTSKGIDINIHTGTRGLEMEFLKNAPPTQVPEGSTFIVGVVLKNRGASDIHRGVLALGIEDDYVQVDSWRGNIIKSSYNDRLVWFDLEGKTRFNPMGEQLPVQVQLISDYLDKQTETYTTTILLTACYQYKTLFNDEVCIDTDIYDTTKEEKVCTVKDKVYGSQGAPVAITKVETRIVPHSDYEDVLIPEFVITIHNRGIGDVIRPSVYEAACTSSSLSHDDLNVVRVEATLSGRRLKCSPSELKLKENGQNKVRCTLTTGIDKEMTSYLAPLVVELDYGYMFTISRDVEIRRTV